MELSNSYRNKIKILAGININESKSDKYEFQIREIGEVPTFYKRKNGGDWLFISTQEFIDEFNGNLVKL